MDGKSEDIRQEKINNLKEIMPEVFTEGKVDVEKLKLTLGYDLNLQDERYVLNWAGKAEAFKVLQAQSTATLSPAPEESIDFEKTQNVFIEGENLEVLKVLQKSYYGKIKMIYIDPPYNTGNDSFIYPDKFSESKDEYLKRIGDKDEAGFLLKEGLFRKNSKESGHYHSNWLSMMYPRLFLARNLLKDDGVIFVSIDDNEVHNLRMIMNEVFGEENFVETFIWRSRLGKGATSKETATLHEYIMVFCKNTEHLNIIGDIRTSSAMKKERIRQWGQGDRRIDRPTMFYPVESKEFGTVLPIKPDGTEGRWRISKEKFDILLVENGVIFEKQIDGRVEAYRIIPEGTITETAQDSILNAEVVKTTAHGSKEISEIFGFKVFDYPKPFVLIKYLLSLVTKETDVVLDFFAGSGTTSQAVYELNKEDGGNRKYICVQLPENTTKESEAYKAGYKTIAEICKGRIKKVVKKIKNEKKKNPDLFANQKKDLDLGFKVFKLKSSNFKIWRNDIPENEKELRKQLDAFENPIKKEAKTDNMLWEILLKSGYDLNTKVEEKKISGCPVFVVSDGEMIVCLSKINESVVKEIVKQPPKKCICLDILFAKNDRLKTNTVLQMKDAGVEFKTI